MQKCPQCGATLPPGALTCQFCGAPLSKNAPQGPRGAGAKIGSFVANERNWVWPAYNAVSVWWFIQGLLMVFRSLNLEGAFQAIGIALGALTALIGLGLILKVELVRGIVNVLAFLQILGGLREILFLFLGAPVGGLLGGLFVLLAFVQVAAAGLMIFLIGETETRAPNF